MEKTTKMSAALKAAVIKLGYDPEAVLWGRRVDGDPHGATLELEGKTQYWVGPFHSVQEGDQIAIVRFD